MIFIRELKNKKYAHAFSELKLFEKIGQFAKAAGIKVIYGALILFYTLQEHATPKLAKSIIIGALGYFILPTDFIPDFLPIVGFSDDLTALIAALVAVSLYVTQEIKFKAKDRLHVWFGEYDYEVLADLEKQIDASQRKTR
jgi:uncharacterized membrane protein YkvA (DUF1232 family)